MNTKIPHIKDVKDGKLEQNICASQSCKYHKESKAERLPFQCNMCRRGKYDWFDDEDEL